MICRRLEQVINTNGCFGRLGMTKADTVVVKFEIVRSLNDFLVTCQSNWNMLESTSQCSLCFQDHDIYEIMTVSEGVIIVIDLRIKGARSKRKIREHSQSFSIFSQVENQVSVARTS